MALFPKRKLAKIQLAERKKIKNEEQMARFQDWADRTVAKLNERRARKDRT